jgi:hypothetical protein
MQLCIRFVNLGPHFIFHNTYLSIYVFYLQSSVSILFFPNMSLSYFIQSWKHFNNLNFISYDNIILVQTCIWGSHICGYDAFCLLGYNTAESSESHHMFRKNSKVEGQRVRQARNQPEAGNKQRLAYSLRYCHVLSDYRRGLDWQLDLLGSNTQLYTITNESLRTL